MADDGAATPMMRQYWDFREKLPANTLLFFRCGDFYEMFGEDAERGAELLGITLTKRGGAPLAGVPYHALNTYLAKALKAGVKIAICEQTEPPKAGKLVKRALVRIITPGTNFDETQLDAKSNNYILALDETPRGGLCAAWIDATTGDFYVAASREPQKLLAPLQALRPSEILVPESWKEGKAPAYLEPLIEWNLITRMPDWKFDAESGRRAVQRALNVNGLEGFGVAGTHPGLGPAGALLAYLTETLCESPSFLRKISELRDDETLLIDAASTRNLEIFKSAAGTREGSLLDAIDFTHTAGGARLLEQWLAAPPRKAEIARERQEGVAAFVAHPSAAERVRTALAYVKDLARILGRLQNHMRTPRELGAVRETLRRVPEIKAEIARLGSPVTDAIAAKISEHADLRGLLESALEEELPATVENAVRAGYNARLDELRDLRKNSRVWVANYETRLQEETQIKNLRVRYNNAFGYYIEVSKSNVARVPADFIRRQTLVNAERYTTAELRRKEGEILHADELVSAQETDLYAELVAAVVARTDSLSETAAALSRLDVLAGWAQLAQTWDYCRPVVDESDALEISLGRHPVVEQMLHRPGVSQHFVPNDTSLQASGTQINLITGPNMAGKSTYIRQVALIALLAQIGCWVPAKAARVGVADRIFCRVGASDELARGNSTFMVEMNETANILNNATPKSLVVLDEIGRGTSTYDGLSIAWAVAEYLHGNGPAGPRTLFATHYHELTRIADTLPRLKNFCVAVKEWNDEIIFVRQVVPGAADRSYGIHVARLAGLPESVVARANEILSDLEGSAVSFENPHPPKAETPDAVAEDPAGTPAKARAAKPRGGKLRDAAAGTRPLPPPPEDDPQLTLF
ncbi:DNA mismatch repair protein MutS [Candidatus Spyradosoma sp. SGI.093]|uniref:DNA mismatch repair protein MutS n=1 Tax=Candidatus Spyradosoma sp. SGI.093 TaxID=3420583 RepID=UPI003D008FEC